MGDTYVVNGAMMTCTFGLAPSSLIVLPARTKQLNHLPRANIMDYAPMVNIMPFGMCNTPSNPTVAAATAAAMGVLTPMPCIPAITAPWMPGNPQCMVQGSPALTRNSQCICMWGGMVRFTTDGQMPGPPPMVKKAMSMIIKSMPDTVKPLTQQELEAMTEEEQEAYQKEMAIAQEVGQRDKYMSEELDSMAERYRANGDEEKAQQCEKASQEYKMMAATKQAEAMNNISNKYRGNEDEITRGNYSRAELEQIKNDSTAKERDLSTQYAKANVEYLQMQKETTEMKLTLDAKNQDVTSKKAAYDAATEKENRLTTELNVARNNAAYFKDEHQRALESGDPDRIAKAKAKMDETENYALGMQMMKDKSSQERTNAFNTYMDAQNAQSDLKKAVQENEKQQNKLKADLTSIDNEMEKERQKTRAANSAMEAMDTKEKADVAKGKYMEARNEANKAHCEFINRQREEQALYKEERELNEKGWKAYNEGDGEKGLAYLRQSMGMGDDISKKKEEVKQARNKRDAARKNMQEAYQEAYGDDVKLAEYSKLIEGQMAQQQLKKTVK